jgi:hypothetical protein
MKFTGHKPIDSLSLFHEVELDHIVVSLYRATGTEVGLQLIVIDV